MTVSFGSTPSALDESEDNLDADLGTSALAAAEIVAAWRDGERAHLPESAREWLEKNAVAITTPDIQLASRATTVVLDLDRSELAQLWDEASIDEWRADVRALLASLERS